MGKKQFEEDFAKFAEYLEKQENQYVGALLFADICASLGIDSDSLDAYLLLHFGLSGGDILRAYKLRLPICFL